MKKQKHINKIVKNSLPLFIVYLLVFLVYAYLGVYFSELLGDSIDVANDTLANYQIFAAQLVKVTLGMIGLYIVYTSIKNIMKKKIFKKIRVDLFAQMIGLRTKELNQIGNENLISNLVNDTKLIEDEYVVNLISLVEDIATLVIAMIVLFTMDIKSAVFILLVSFIPVVVPMFFIQKLQNQMEEYSEENGIFLQNVTECVEGLETYKCYQGMNQLFQKFQTENKEVTKKRKTAYFQVDKLMAALSVAANLVLIGVLCFGMFMALSGSMSIGQVFALMFIASNVIQPISSISQNLPSMLSVKEVVTKYDAYFDMDQEKEGKLSLERGIEIKNYSLDLGERRILNEINLSFEKGKKYALVGGSGSGKSTLLKSMLGYYSEYEGDIIADGKILEAADFENMFQHVTYLTQQTKLFTCSIVDNMTMFKEMDDTSVKDAAKKANVSGKIEKLENKYDTIVLDDGKNFSGGEKQRIAIARALLSGKKIFFLDEATSALDYANYCAIEEMLLSIPNITLVTVTHRIDESILSRYNQLIVMKDGNVETVGQFKQVYQNNSYFKNLYDSQKMEKEFDKTHLAIDLV